MAATRAAGPSLSPFFRFSIMPIVLLLHLCSNTVLDSTHLYTLEELNGLQALWAAWNTSTPDLSTNLAGWSSTQIYPCGIKGSLAYEGVMCSTPTCSGDEMCNRKWYNTTIIGLSLSNASLVGTLPNIFSESSKQDSNLGSLNILQLTGNPRLSGSLPDSLRDLWLYTLDLHDNGFNGTIPNDLVLPEFIQYLDLSGNQITGQYPLHAFAYLTVSIRTLSIGRNKFYGPIRGDALQDKTELRKFDISSNNFIGKLPDLFNNTKLQYLDVSKNQFEGLLPNLTKFANLNHVNLQGNRFNGSLAKLSDVVNVHATTMLDISNNHLTGPLLSNLKQEDLGVIQTLKVSGNQFEGHIPNLSIFQEVTIMNLSGNHLTLPLDWNVYKIGSIQELYLDNNNISGILDITQMLTQDANQSLTSSLKILSLMNNHIIDVKVTSKHFKNRAFDIRLLGNPYCNGVNNSSAIVDDAKRCFCKQICYISRVNKADRRKIIGISVSTSVVLVALVAVVLGGATLFQNRQYKRYLMLQFQQKFEEFNVKPTIYSYQELKVATRDFHEENKLGQGGYGAVYKGVLPNGSVVAVKQLFVKPSQSRLDEFFNEVVLITGMKHKNLVNLKGCCVCEDSKILVYEYVNNFDVDQVLLGKGPRRQLVSWTLRLKICLGIARGLHYLHALAHPRVIHRDIKASNILLNKNLEPKVGDFGLALLLPDEESHMMTVHVAGTKGYLAPEYATLGQLSEKADVYSFGIVCLEIISGRRNIDESLPQEQVFLTPWAWKLHTTNNLLDLVDPTLHFNNSEEEDDVQRVIRIALMCAQVDSVSRPSMNHIVFMLEKDINLEIEVALNGGERELQEFDTSMRSQDAIASSPI